MKNILVLNGPNLNLQGLREKEHYGAESLMQINKTISAKAVEFNFSVEFAQSNSEAELINMIHQSLQSIDAMLLNAAAYSHTSIAIRDALIACKTKFIEIHLSNLAKREHFRHNSYLTDIALGCIMGFGPSSYYLGLEALAYYFSKEKNHD